MWRCSLATPPQRAALEGDPIGTRRIDAKADTEPCSITTAGNRTIRDAA